MVSADAAVLRDPGRLAAADRTWQALPALPMPLAAIARVAAELTDAPMGLLTVVGDDQEHVGGTFGLPAALVSGGRLSAKYSVCKFVVSADTPIGCTDMHLDADAETREHPLSAEYGVRSFFGVPLRDARNRPVGSLTVLDTRARPWTSTDLAVLTGLSSLLDRVPGADEGPLAERASPSPDGMQPLAALDTVEVLDAIAEAFYTLDAHGAITSWNAAARDLTGYSPAEAIGQRVETLLRAEYEGRPVPEVLAHLLADPAAEPIAGTAVLRHRDGRRLHTKVRLSVLPSAGRAVCVFLTDITAQVVAAHAATAAAARSDTEAESQRGFAEALLDSLDEGVIAVDATGRPVVFNAALRRLHGLSDGLSAEAARAAAVAQLCHADGTPIPAQELSVAHALRGHTVRDVETLVREPGKPDRFMLASAQPVHAPDDRLIGAVCTIREITDRRRAEQFRDCQLAVAQILAADGDISAVLGEALQTIAQTLHWPYLSLRLADEDTDSLVRLAYWQADGCDLVALLPERLPRTALDIPAAVWATAEPVWEPDLAASPRLTDAASRARVRAYADCGIHSALAVPVMDAEDVRGVLTCFAESVDHDQFLLTGLLTGVATQIGQFLGRRRAETLQHELARARADFTALIGHDMRTPLTTIATYTQLLIDDPAPRTDSDRQLLDGINRNATALRSLVDGLLDVAALESGDDVLLAEPVNLSTLVVRACDAVRPMFAGNLVVEVPTESPVWVTGDLGRLRQAADTLLSALISEVTEDGAVRVSLSTTADAAVIEIAGRGELGESARSFQRFSHANATGVGDTGAGVDLVLCRLIAERHAGALALEDRPDGTHLLTLRLPLLSPPPTSV